MNPNKALWEKGDFTAIAAFMRESGETVVESLGVKPPLRALDLGCGDRGGRKIGVVVHHVASMYPIEIQLVSLLAAGRPISGVTWDAVDTINRDHAKENDNVGKEGALALLKTNSAAAVPAQLRDAKADRAGGWR